MVKQTLLLSTLLLPALSLAGQSDGKRPNIILFLVDDMGWQDTSLPFWKEKTFYTKKSRQKAQQNIKNPYIYQKF